MRICLPLCTLAVQYANKSYQCCLCVSCISQAHSTATGPGAYNCWSDGIASSSRLPWRQWGVCSQLQHRTTHLPWSCTSWQKKNTDWQRERESNALQVRAPSHLAPAEPITVGTSCYRAQHQTWIKHLNIGQDVTNVKLEWARSVYRSSSH